MNPSVLAKTALAGLFGSLHIPDAILWNRSGKRYLILMYHRVLPSGACKIPLQAGMYVEPETFEDHLKYLNRHFRVIPFSDKFAPSSAGRQASSGRPECILTFDDGWRDFFDFAYPALKRNRVPATVFLPTGYIGTNRWFWTDRLAGVLESKGTREKQLEPMINRLKQRGENEANEAIARMTEGEGVDASSGDRVFLNWEEVREMASSGLVSFGSHTHNHRILVHLEEVDVKDELVRSKETLLREKAVDPSFIPFCYPNGDWNDRISRMVRETGYHATVSTASGWNAEGASPFELKRVAIHQDMTRTRGLFGCRMAGIL